MSRKMGKKEYIASWLRIDEFEDDVMTDFNVRSTLYNENEGEDGSIDGDDENLW